MTASDDVCRPVAKAGGNMAARKAIKRNMLLRFCSDLNRAAPRSDARPRHRKT
jgi:hypothetical protein